MKTIAFTGHRPNKLFGYDLQSIGNQQISLIIESALNREVKQGSITVITGGALGIDQMAALAAESVSVTKQIIAEPFEGFNSKWPKESIRQYESLKKRCNTEVVQVCEPGYAAWKMQKRNEWMVDHADELWAWWNDTPGGTMNCVKYAMKVKKPVVNLYQDIEAILE